MTKLKYTYSRSSDTDDKCTPFEGCIAKHGKRNEDASDLLDCISSQLDERDDMHVAITAPISAMGKSTLWKKMTVDYPELAEDVIIHSSPLSCDDEEAYTAKLYTTLLPIREDADMVIVITPKTDDVYKEFMKSRKTKQEDVEDYLKCWRKETSELRRYLAIDVEKPFIDIKVDIEE